MALVILLALGSVGSLIAERAKTAQDSRGPSLGALAGFRAVAADVLWLRTYFAWERRDAEALRMLLAATTAIDPRPLAYWVEGARMLAYDLPHWELRHHVASPAAVQQRLMRQHTEAALRHLAQARRHHPNRAILWIEEGNIHLNVRQDLEQATEAYRRAAALADAPHYSGRIYAELLRRTGRLSEALAFLREIYPALERISDPWERELASPDVVLARIRELEDALAAGQL